MCSNISIEITLWHVAQQHHRRKLLRKLMKRKNIWPVSFAMQLHGQVKCRDITSKNSDILMTSCFCSLHNVLALWVAVGNRCDCTVWIFVSHVESHRTPTTPKIYEWHPILNDRLERGWFKPKEGSDNWFLVEWTWSDWPWYLPFHSKFQA